MVRARIAGRPGLTVRRTLLLAAVMVMPGAAQAQQPSPSPQRPNVVVIWTDDQTLEEMRFMPKTRALLGAAGVTFTNYFDSFSLCCPARATFLTGQYAHNDGVRSNRLPDGGYYALDSKRTLPLWLQRAGYYTALVGKYLNEYGKRNQLEIPPGWNDWHALVDPTTYHYYNYLLNENGALARYCATPDPSCYQVDVIAQKAVEAVGRGVASGRPFFLWVTPIAPHAGHPRDLGDPAKFGTPSPPPRYAGTVSPDSMPIPRSFDERDVSDKPRAVRSRPRLTTTQIAAIKTNYAQEAEAVMAADDLVASVIGALRSARVLDRTIVMFSSDNGFFHGEHRIPGEKVLWYEPSIHLPLLIRGPGVPRGQTRGQLVWNGDLAPTILAAAGARPSGRTPDGTSLWPLIADPTRELGRDILIEGPPGLGGFVGIRTEHYKYAEYATGERELYYLVRDPDELRNLARDPRYRRIRELLAARLAALRSCKGASCRVPPVVRLVPRSCARGVLRVQVQGDGIVGVALSVNGVARNADRDPPFVLATPVPRTMALRVRARVSVRGDRSVTLDTTTPACR